MTIPTRTEAGARAYALLEDAAADPAQALAISRQLGIMYQGEQDSMARSEIGDAQSQVLKLIPDGSLPFQLGRP